MPTAQVSRGAKVARELGWPATERGFLGAAGGLIDPDSFRFQRIRPSAVLAARYQAQSQHAVQQRLLRSINMLLGQ